VSNLPPLASVPLPSPPAPEDQLKANLQAIFNLLLPFLAYMVPWEYRVIAVTPGGPGTPTTVDAVPEDPLRCPHGPQSGVPVWRDAGGLPSVPVIGARGLLRFHDGSPAKPAWCAWDPAIPYPTPPPTYVPPGPLSLASALVAFATPLSTGAIDPAVAAASLGLLTSLQVLT